MLSLLSLKTQTGGKMKQVQIPQELFIMLLKYHIEEDKIFQKEIIDGLYKKIDLMLAREAYNKYKNAETAWEKEDALAKYIELKEEKS